LSPAELRRLVSLVTKTTDTIIQENKIEVNKICLVESVKFLRELSSPFVLGCFSKFIQMSCFTGFHFRRTLSAGTASASSLVKNTLCGVRGLVLFPQESPPYVPARQCSMLIIDVALVRRVFYFKNQPSHVKLSHKAYSDPCWLMQAFGHG